MKGGKKPLEYSVNNSYTPGTDFYSYINNEWLKTVHLPPYDGSYSVSEEIEDDVRDKLLTMIQDLRTSNPDDPISKISTSFLQNSYQKHSIRTLHVLLRRIACMTTKEDIGSMIGIMNRIQAATPLSIIVSGDSYKTSQCCVFLYESEIGLSSRHYYDESTVIHHYKRLLHALTDLFYTEPLETVVHTEKMLLPYLSNSDERYNINFTYNPHSYEKLRAEYKDIPWSSIFLSWGLTESIMKKTTFVVTNKRYVAKLEDMFRSFDLSAWKTWLTCHMILSFLEYLPPPYDDLQFHLFGKILKGKTEKIPQKYLTLHILKKYTPNDLGKLFVDNLVAPETKHVATKLIQTLKRATIRRLKRLTWMDPSTREKAVEKVKHMKFQVAHPDVFSSETKDCEIAEDEPLQNILNLNAADTDRMIEDLKKRDCDKSVENWNDGTFEVNAYYYSEGNMMVIPAGILRAPFFDVNRSHAWNLGGIGSAIGHEITHGFDVDGRMYDAKGNYKNWWTEQDVANYELCTKAIVSLFDGQNYMEGKVDGTLTLSENLSDLGGMAIALEALNTLLENSTEAERKKAYIEFFTSYGISWRNKDRPKKALESLFTNSHAPSQFRVNLIVKQFVEFYQAFDISEGDPGWTDPKDRIVLW